MTDNGQNWVEEVHRENFGTKFKVKKKLFSGKSPFQTVEIFETQNHGRMLLNDGLVMLCERDEAIYHEMITHPAVFVHPNPRNVLIIGGGDGGTAREILRHKNIEKCTMVEIDKMVVDACKEHIPQTASVLGHDPRLNLLIEDGVKFIAETKERFDIVIIDSTDPIGPATPLFGLDFYKNISSKLSSGGIVVAQAESPFYEREAQKSLYGIMKSQFEMVNFYNFSNLTYPGGLWSFAFASNERDPIGSFQPERVTNSRMKFYYYNADIHRAAFSLPSFQAY